MSLFHKLSLASLIRQAAVSCIMACISWVHAQKPESVAAPAADNSPAAQLASFTSDDRFETGLFADESMGVANPVCMRWDAAGRLWVLCTWAYPQLAGGDKPDDKLLILEDTNGDGKADRVSTFIDGLNMPTGFALGHGGVYVGEGQELLHFKDTDQDGRADKREVIFTGFGTGDTHQNINSFTWSPGGELFFCQGLHTFSRIETPWGLRGLEEYGSWRLRPLRRELHPFRRSSSGGNPWGVTFGDWGEPFIKSNGPDIHELLPGMISTDHTLVPPDIGRTKIKSMIIEILDSPHLPDDMQGDMLIAGYFAHIVDRLRPSADGSGHKLENLPPLLTSSHSAFRPVDISVGPDGAIYVLDWFNPIIGHYQASFRHPDRDKSHGRIWRVTAKNRSLTTPPPLASMNAAALCEQLAAPARWVRQQAKLRLMDLPTAEVIPAVAKWVDSLKPAAPGYEHALFEAIGVYESHEVVHRPLLEKLLGAKEPLARAYATRVVGRWNDRLTDPLALLAHSALDESPRVRLEAMVASAEVRSAAAIKIAALATGKPMDRFLEHAFVQAVHALADFWKPELVAGRLQFPENDHLVRVLRAYGGDDTLQLARQRLADNVVPTALRQSFAVLLASLGNTADAGLALQQMPGHAPVLAALADSVKQRGLRPPTTAEKALQELMASDETSVRAAAIHLAGLWKLNSFTAPLGKLASDEGESEQIRVACIESLGFMGQPTVAQDLVRLTTTEKKSSIRVAAMDALSKLDVGLAAKALARLVSQSAEQDLNRMMSSVMQRKAGANALQTALVAERPSVDAAKLVLRWLNSAGRTEPALTTVLRDIIGSMGETPEYSLELVNKLAADALAQGDATRGMRVFQSPTTSCTSCHALEGMDGITTSIKGPSLTAVAAGLPIELIIESVLWPERQIKEGYQPVTVTTKDGRYLNGFFEAQERGALRMRDVVSGEPTTIPLSAIAERNSGGSIMPRGLTAGLTRGELLDLIKFLATLKTTDPLPKN